MLSDRQILNYYERHIYNKKDDIDYITATFVILLSNFVITSQYIKMNEMIIPFNISFLLFHMYLLYNININMNLFNILLFYLFFIWILTNFIANKLSFIYIEVSICLNISSWIYYIISVYRRGGFNLYNIVYDILVNGPLFLMLDIMRLNKINYNILDVEDRDNFNM